MLNHHFKLAFRSLLKNRTFSLINILGLSLGLTCVTVIGLYAYTELTFDRFHARHAQIFRVNKYTNEKDKGAGRDAITPGKLAPWIEQNLPEVAAATRFRPWFSKMLVSYDTVRLKLDDVVYADNSFFKIFSFPFVRGDRKTALQEPFSAVITEETARKYFRQTDPIGKTLITLNNIPVTVRGVVKDPTFNSSIKFTMLISWATVSAPSTANYFSWMDNFRTEVAYTFVYLKQNTSPDAVAAKISALLHSYRNNEEFEYRPYLQSLDDIHLHSSDIAYAQDFRTNSIALIGTLLTIAGFILLIASFNFINLTTAGALGRAKETGVQKVLGATNAQLISKFFSESMVACLVAMLVALSAATLLIPLFDEIASTGMKADILISGKVLGALVALLLAVSMMAGLYPAIFLARFRSTDVFRNIIKSAKNSWLRKSLVVAQFALSLLLIVGTIVVNRQMHYLATKDLGFDKEQVMILELGNTNIENTGKCNSFVQALKQLPGVASVSATNRIPGQTFTGYGIIPQGHSLSEHMEASVLETDADFAKTYNIRLAQGRFFSAQFPSDTTEGIVVNQSLVRYAGWKDPIGKTLEIYQARKGRVIGVMKDFNFASLHQSVQPLAIMLNNNPIYASVKIKPRQIPSTLLEIQRTWTRYDQQFPFEYYFIDESLNRYYRADARLMYALNIFAVLAICIACMGLFGLSIYSARQRTKEIGIRKVLGASVTGIMRLMAKEFVAMVLLAMVVIFPVAWWATTKWLDNFAYRVPVSWWVFVIAGLAGLLVALVTISFQSVKAATANPINSLRNE